VNERQMIERSVPLIDLEVASDGRTVTAYAATFDETYAVSDAHGNYDEVIDRRAFNKTLADGIARVGVLYNHGLTLYGTPSEQFSKPLGSPVEIKAEKLGLLTVTRYNKTPLADEVLEMIRNGDVRAQSFRGAIVQSAPTIMRAGRQLIRRLELGLKEYGPAPFPTNAAAGILAVRSITDTLDSISDADLAALVRERIRISSPAADGTGDPDTGETPAVDSQADTHEAPAADEAPVDTGPSPELLEAELAAWRARNKSQEDNPQ